MPEYKEEWTEVFESKKKFSMRGQGKRRGKMVLGAMFDYHSARALDKIVVKWWNFPWKSEEDKKFFFSSSARNRCNWSKVYLSTGDYELAMMELCK